MKQNINPLAAVICIIVTIGVAAFLFNYMNKDKPIPTDFVDPNKGKSLGESEMQKKGMKLPPGIQTKPANSKPKESLGSDASGMPAEKPAEATK